MAVASAVAYRPPRLARKRTRQAVLVWCFLAPSLAIFLLYRIIPLLWNVVLSFADWAPLRTMRWAGLDQYEEMLHDDVFWEALWPSVIVANIWQMLGFYMIILLTGLQNIPPSLYEAAAIDGANARRRFWRITLPLLKPSLFLCIVIGMLNSFTSFDLVYVMTGGGPGRATELLVTYIYKLGFSQTRFDYAAAVTIVFFVLLVAIAWMANRLSGGNAGAVETD